MYLSKIFHTTASIIIFLILGLYFLHPIPLDVSNGDMGMHLTLGKIIVTTGSVPKLNLLSFTEPTYPFINTHWLSEVFFYVLYSIGGFNNLIILSVLLALSTFFLLFWFAAKRYDFLTVVIISLISLQVLYERTEVRPELFGYLILSFFLVILYKFKEHYTKWIFLLIPLELLWVNFHIYYFVGIIVLILFIIDALLDRKDTLLSKKFYTLIAVTFGCSLATLCNPNFFKGALYPLFVLNNYGFTVEENVNFFKAISDSAYNHSDIFVFFILSVAILWIGVFVGIKKMKPIDIFLSLFFTFFGFFAIRNFSLFALGIFIPSIKIWSPLMQSFYKKMYTLNERDLLWIKIIYFVVILLFIFPTIKSNIANDGFGLGITDNAKNAIDFFVTKNLKGPIFNNFDIGNYLVYRLYPTEKSFVYGSPEAFPKKFFQNIYTPMQVSPEKFNEEEKKYKLNSIILEYPYTSIITADLIKQLSTNNEWKMVYLDSSIVIFVKNTSANQQIIEKYLITQNNVKINKADLDDKTKIGQLTNFFKFVNWDRPRANMIIQYLKFDPTNCAAIESIVYLLQKTQDPRTSIYVNKYEQTCSQ